MHDLLVNMIFSCNMHVNNLIMFSMLRHRYVNNRDIKYYNIKIIYLTQRMKNKNLYII